MLFDPWMMHFAICTSFGQGLDPPVGGVPSPVCPGLSGTVFLTAVDATGRHQKGKAGGLWVQDGGPGSSPSLVGLGEAGMRWGQGGCVIVGGTRGTWLPKEGEVVADPGGALLAHARGLRACKVQQLP